MMGPGRPAAECDNEELVDEFEVACRGRDYEFAGPYRNEIVRRLSFWNGADRDPEGLSIMTPIFDRSKFTPGRAIRLVGYDEDGFGINSVYLIRGVDMNELTVINHKGQDETYHVGLFLNKPENEDDPHVKVTFLE